MVLGYNVLRKMVASDVASVVDQGVVPGAIRLSNIKVARIIGVVDNAVADFRDFGNREAFFSCFVSHRDQHFLEKLNGVVGGHCFE